MHSATAPARFPRRLWFSHCPHQQVSVTLPRAAPPALHTWRRRRRRKRDRLLRTDFGRAVGVPAVLAQVRARLARVEAPNWWPLAAAALVMVAIAGVAGFRLGAGLSAFTHGADEAIAEPWHDENAKLRTASRAWGATP